ncbi:MAG: potassium transporter Kup [Hyphomicrobiales bacterium]|nr:potassium transporter Kup [Hyphomicrobiales bacterium]
MSKNLVQEPPVAGASNGHATMAPDTHATSLAALALGSIGVVFGDIGTSPLYALQTSLGHISNSAMNPQDVVGIVSLLLWALFFTVTAKYVIFLMRADNKGEGGTLSLMALAQNAFGRRTQFIFLLGVAGAALFFGDAMITPAISVLSAVEGMSLVTPVLNDFEVPITVVILISLFWVQSRGTAKVASYFGPVMAIFFTLIAVLGLIHIPDDWRILTAFSPLPGVRFLFGNGLLGFMVLGSVFLAVTGAEALYADMGHFGRKPIQLSWLVFVLPALMLNYLGQGAMVMALPATVKNPFFLLAPPWLLLPLVLLSTLATVIASQAVITGAFSLTRQAIQLGLLPRMEIQHKSESQEGQIYIPRINTMLLIGVLALVFLFRNSTALASAYGIAVTGTMVVTTMLAFVVVRYKWKWSLALSVAIILGFLSIDMSFLAANLLKIVDGGYVPLTIALVMMLMMWTWMRGSALLVARTKRDSIPIRELIGMLAKSKPTRVAGTAIFLTSDTSVAPSALMHNLKHNKVLHERVLIMSVKTEDVPKVTPANRFEIEKLSEDFSRVTLHYGFMETPRMPLALAQLRKSGMKFDIMTTSFFLGKRTIKPAINSDMPMWQDKIFIALSRQSANATDFFSIPSDRVVELGAQVTI